MLSSAGLRPLFEALRAADSDGGGRVGPVPGVAGVRRLSGGRNNVVYAARVDGEPVCVKVYRHDRDRRAAQEWAALGVMAGAGFAGAAAPVYFEAEPAPVLAMRLLSGSPLGQASLTLAQADAVGGVFGELHEIRRGGRHGAAPEVRLSAAGMLAQVSGTFARLAEDAATGLRGEVADRWRRWRAGEDCGVLAEAGAVVFGQGDPNLSNCLWDSGRIRLVDFEYAGWSDPVYELALLVEHVQSRATSDLMWARVLQRYGLPGADSRRLWAARRLVAWFWVAELWPAGPADDDRFVAQAARAAHIMAAHR